MYHNAIATKETTIVSCTYMYIKQYNTNVCIYIYMYIHIHVLVGVRTYIQFYAGAGIYIYMNTCTLGLSPGLFRVVLYHSTSYSLAISFDVV